MGQTFTLVDYENIQPAGLVSLLSGSGGVLVFVGSNQPKVSIDLAMGMQALGSRAQYVKISGSGKNALDFHLAFHLGKLSAEHPGAGFTIVSRDSGFDPLVAYMRTLGHACRRVEDIQHAATSVSPQGASTPKVQELKALPTSPVDRANFVAAKLRTSTKPRTVARLNSMMSTWFRKSIDEKDLGAVLKALVSLKLIAIDGEKVTYKL